MSNPNILQPVPGTLNDSLNLYRVVLSDTTPPALDGTTNITWQQDQFGNLSACVAGGGGGGGSSVGTAGQVQMVGATAGSFAASSLTDDGTNITTDEQIIVGNAVTLTNNGSSSTPGVNALLLNGTNVEFDTQRIASVGSLLILDTTGGGDPNAGEIVFRTGVSGSYLTLLDLTTTRTSLNGVLTNLNTTTTTSATAGAASTLPVTPLGYWHVNINGTDVKVPYYDN